MAGPYGNFLPGNQSGTGSFAIDKDQNPVILPSGNAGYNPRQNGVFALHPLATPKYAKNVGLRDAEFRDTLARLYISLADSGDAVRDAYLRSLPGDEATQSLAKVLLGANSQGGTGFIDFFLTSANESFQEITQIDKVLGDDYVAFFYGQQPPVFQYQGVLLNSMQDDQRSGFAKAYQQMLRGTQLARRGALARLRYDSVIVSGVLTATTQQLNADNEMAVPFSFSFLVKEYVILDNPMFSKKSVEEYVQLAADSSIAGLQPIGAVSDDRVHAVTVTTPRPASVSAAGAEENTDVVDAGLSALQGLFDKAVTAVKKEIAASNIRGTVSSVAPVPPDSPR